MKFVITNQSKIYKSLVILKKKIRFMPKINVYKVHAKILATVHDATTTTSGLPGGGNVYNGLDFCAGSSEATSGWCTVP